jgi:uncharacterized protein YacL
MAGQCGEVGRVARRTHDPNIFQEEGIWSGVGYMDDGTMVVVENGHDYIGEYEVVVTKVLQTGRRMVFARRRR